MVLWVWPCLSALCVSFCICVLDFLCVPPFFCFACSYTCLYFLRSISSRTDHRPVRDKIDLKKSRQAQEQAKQKRGTHIYREADTDTQTHTHKPEEQGQNHSTVWSHFSSFQKHDSNFPVTRTPSPCLSSLWHMWTSSGHVRTAHCLQLNS